MSGIAVEGAGVHRALCLPPHGVAVMAEIAQRLGFDLDADGCGIERSPCCLLCGRIELRAECCHRGFDRGQNECFDRAEVIAIDGTYVDAEYMEKHMMRSMWRSTC